MRRRRKRRRRRRRKERKEGDLIIKRQQATAQLAKQERRIFVVHSLGYGVDRDGDVDGDDEERESGGEAETWAEKEKGPESAKRAYGNKGYT